jgi:hypothetical protein
MTEPRPWLVERSRDELLALAWQFVDALRRAGREPSDELIGWLVTAKALRLD